MGSFSCLNMEYLKFARFFLSDMKLLYSWSSHFQNTSAWNEYMMKAETGSEDLFPTYVSAIRVAGNLSLALR